MRFSKINRRTAFVLCTSFYLQHIYLSHFLYFPTAAGVIFLRHLILELEQADDKGAQDKGQQG